MRAALAENGDSSPYRKPGIVEKVVAAELPWGTRYKIQACVAKSRQRFAMITDLTIRGKERFRAMCIEFAQTTYAEAGRG